ncbi:predicted protein [Naegleria gruberi]|uniref:Predicted protein n=1 Tax=Naegleria gruberi TaxID=5762 RepID=D2VG70_NAEGR|nr:uncharacterized protein NAEGRDRAFT_79858 [Naegleria gruberi]EFC44220.1 predicted protein [Naegleria gruberi]|eukprot:XP_002676964.1 predicted protein [Naegleria gruberi strain NEG-M]
MQSSLRAFKSLSRSRSSSTLSSSIKHNRNASILDQSINQVRNRQKLLIIEHPNQERVFFIPTCSNGNTISMNLLMSDIQESLLDHDLFRHPHTTSGGFSEKVHLMYPKEHHKRVVNILSQRSFKDESKDPLDALYHQADSNVNPVTKNKQLIKMEYIIPRKEVSPKKSTQSKSSSLKSSSPSKVSLNRQTTSEPSGEENQ